MLLFKKITPNKYVVKTDEEFNKKALDILSTMYNGKETKFSSIIKDKHFHTVVSCLISSEFIGNIDSKNVDIPIYCIDVYIKEELIKVTCGTVNVDENTIEHVNGVLYE